MQWGCVSYLNGGSVLAASAHHGRNIGERRFDVAVFTAENEYWVELKVTDPVSPLRSITLRERIPAELALFVVGEKEIAGAIPPEIFLDVLQDQSTTVADWMLAHRWGAF